MNSKKLLISSIISFFLLVPSFADSFTDAIQDLAYYTACIGQYSATEAGGGWYDDPHDYYTPQMIATRLAQESGNMTRTATFYGICFDYAQFAYNYVGRYLSYYKSQGLYEAQFWIAGTHDNPNSIELQYPGNKNNYTTVQNGVYVKRPANNPYRTVKTHRLQNQGERATHHAWVWIQRADGVQFWVDPTWTDNLGYVVYGYVSSSGEEIQCRPDKDYCANYPSYLNELPMPPSYGNTIPPSSTANSTNREETIKDAGRIYTDIITGKTIHASDDDLALILSAGFHTPLDNLFNASTMGFSISCEGVPVTADIWHSMIIIWQLDYYKLDSDSALLFDVNLGYQLGFDYWVLGIYGGGGIGWSADGAIPLTFKNAGFEWKWTAGIRLLLKKISLRTEISYLKEEGYMLGMHIGIPIANKTYKRFF